MSQSMYMGMAFTGITICKNRSRPWLTGPTFTTRSQLSNTAIMLVFSPSVLASIRRSAVPMPHWGRAAASFDTITATGRRPGCSAVRPVRALMPSAGSGISVLASWGSGVGVAGWLALWDAPDAGVPLWEGADPQPASSSTAIAAATARFASFMGVFSLSCSKRAPADAGRGPRM